MAGVEDFAKGHGVNGPLETWAASLSKKKEPRGKIYGTLGSWAIGRLFDEKGPLFEIGLGLFTLLRALRPDLDVSVCRRVIGMILTAAYNDVEDLEEVLASPQLLLLIVDEADEFIRRDLGEQLYRKVSALLQSRVEVVWVAKIVGMFVAPNIAIPEIQAKMADDYLLNNWITEAIDVIRAALPPVRVIVRPARIPDPVPVFPVSVAAVSDDAWH
jgi:hypothetical protein